MNRRGHRGKVDANHTAVCNGLRAIGVRVLSLAPLGDGAPDALTWYRGRLRLLEIKTAKGKVTTDQLTFVASGWPVHIVRTLDEAVAVVCARD